MSRKRASVRREEILAATVEEIESTGLRALRVADVAKRLGLSASLVIYHFVTKEALVAAAFAHAGENDLYRARRIVASNKPARTRFDELVAWYLPSSSSRSWSIWMDGWSAALFDEELQRTLRALDREWRMVLSSVIADGLDSGDFTLPRGAGEDASAPATPEAAASRILAYLDGLAVRHMVRVGQIPRAEMLAWIADFTASVLGTRRPS